MGTGDHGERDGLFTYAVDTGPGAAPPKGGAADGRVWIRHRIEDYHQNSDITFTSI